MAGNIKGIVVEIGGNTTALEKALSSVNKESKKLQSELNSVQRLLKFDPNNAELLAQKQKLLNDTVENTKKKLDALKEAQAQVQEQFEKGELGADKYRAFQRELARTEQSLRNAEGALQDMADEQEKTQSSTKELNRLLEVTGSSIEDYSDALGGRLVRAIQNGTASAKDLEKAFRHIAKEATGSEEHIDQLRESLQKLDAGETSIRKVRGELQKLQTDADNTGDALSNIAAGAAAGAAGAVGLSGVIAQSLEQDTMTTKIDVSFNIPEESKQAVKDATHAIQAYGFESIEALEAVRRQWALNGEQTDAENQKIIKAAGVISKLYGNIDLNELIQESTQLADALDIGQYSALAMTNQLLKMGFPPEEIDILAEYAQQLDRAGYNAAQIQGIFAAGIESDSWNIDNLMDGIKEGRVLLAEFGVGIDDTTAKLIEGTGISATQLQEWGKAVASGGQAGQTAMTEVSLALAGIQDETTRNAIGTRLFGTLWEEQGTKITETITGAKDNLGDLTENQQTMNDTISQMDTSSFVELNNALLAMHEALAPIYTKVAEFITKVAEWIAQNPQIAAGIAIVVSIVGVLIGIITTLIGIFKLLTPVFRIIGVVARIVAAAIAGISAPVWIAIAVIAAIIAIGVLLYKNWQKISDGAMEMSKKVGDKFMEMHDKISAELGKIKTSIEVKWNNIKAWLKNIDLKSIGRDIMQGLANGITSAGEAVKRAAANVGNGIAEKVKSILKLGSPSRLMMEYGENTGEGFAIGIRNSLNNIKNMSGKMAEAATTKIDVNHSLPANSVPGKEVTVNLHSPKALDVREANKQFRKTMNSMALMW